MSENTATSQPRYRVKDSAAAPTTTAKQSGEPRTSYKPRAPRESYDERPKSQGRQQYRPKTQRDGEVRPSKTAYYERQDKPKSTLSSRIELLPRKQMVPTNLASTTTVKEADLSKLLQEAEKQQVAKKQSTGLVYYKSGEGKQQTQHTEKKQAAEQEQSSGAQTQRETRRERPQKKQYTEGATEAEYKRPPRERRFDQGGEYRRSKSAHSQRDHADYAPQTSRYVPKVKATEGQEEQKLAPKKYQTRRQYAEDSYYEQEPVAYRTRSQSKRNRNYPSNYQSKQAKEEVTAKKEQFYAQSKAEETEVISSDEELQLRAEDEEEPLSPANEEYVSGMIKHCSKHVKILKADEVRKVCIEFEFDDVRIKQYLAAYEIEDKYKGVEAYQWNETLTREQKDHKRRQRLAEAERKKRNEIRLRKLREERFRAIREHEEKIREKQHRREANEARRQAREAARKKAQAEKEQEAPAAVKPEDAELVVQAEAPVQETKPKKEKKPRKEQNKEPKGQKVWRAKQATASEVPASQPITVQEEADDDTESLLRKTVNHDGDSQHSHTPAKKEVEVQPPQPARSAHPKQNGTAPHHTVNFGAPPGLPHPTQQAAPQPTTTMYNPFANLSPEEQQALYQQMLWQQQMIQQMQQQLFIQQQLAANGGSFAK